MNLWTEMSIEFASQRNYLDELFKIYPISSNLKRDLPAEKINKIENAFNGRNNIEIIKSLLELEHFPIKDSYVAYLRNDKTAIERNPQTINRIAGILYDMGLNNILDKCTEPKETNRQIGPMFKYWISKGFLGVPVYTNSKDFLNTTENAVLNVSDTEMKNFAKKYLGYQRDKGLDFLARFNGKYIVGEAKFITDFGGHQTAQFFDAVLTLTSKFYSNSLNAEVIPIAVMDGVLYIKNNRKMYTYLKNHEDQIILSGLCLREFLFSI